MPRNCGLTTYKGSRKDYSFYIATQVPKHPHQMPKDEKKLDIKPNKKHESEKKPRDVQQARRPITFSI